MYLCDFGRDYRVDGRKLYDDLHLEDILTFAEFYIENEAMIFDKSGSSIAELDFRLSLPDALSICKRYVPERNAKRVLLKLQRYRRQQIKEIESGYYALRDRVSELGTELEKQKKLAETMQSDAEKSQLFDAFLKSDSAVTAHEFNAILRQNGLAKTYTTTVFKIMERWCWIDNSGLVKHLPTAKGIDEGYVRLGQDIKNARTWQYAPLVITAKGQLELFKYFKVLSPSHK